MNVFQGLDAGTSDDSGRASEQLHGSGIPRDSQDADSSRDHLSDVSWRHAARPSHTYEQQLYKVLLLLIKHLQHASINYNHFIAILLRVDRFQNSFLS